MKKYLIGIVLIIGLVIGFFVGQEYTKIKIANEFKKAFSGINTNTSTSQVKDEQKVVEKMIKKAIDKNVGDEIELATIKFKINSSTEESMIQSSYGQPKVADEGTKFVVLDVTATNITKASFNFSTNDLVMIDKDNTQYKPYEETIGNIDDYMTYEQLSPNIPKTGKLVYQLPKTTDSYSFLIGKAGTDTNYKIKVK